MVAKRSLAKKQRIPGRPRDPELEARILEVALQHLAASGYSRMSLDRVAEESGASKPTLYRRWASKADLATAALRTIQINEALVDTASTPGDLTGVLQNFRRSLLRPNGMSLIGTVLAEEAHTPELLALFRERLLSPRRQTLRTILEKANSRNELRAGIRLNTVANLLVGAFYAHYLADPNIPAAFAAELVDIVWRGIKA